MEIILNSIQYQIGEDGQTTSISIGYQGRGGAENFNARVELKEGDLDNMTRKEIDEAGQERMKEWFNETSE